MKLYGSLDNRLMEQARQPEEITVGMGATEIFYSDRQAYEVIEVKDQKHVTIRQYTAKSKGAYSNDWELISEESNPTYEMVKRGKYWYSTATLTKEDIEAIGCKQDERGLWSTGSRDGDRQMWNWMIAGFDFEKIMEQGKQTKYWKKNILFGRADHYFDYEF